MKSFSYRRGTGRAFTLLEILAAMAILSIVVLVTSGMIGQMNLAWISGQQRLQDFQNGRAILEIMARDLAPAAISQDLQFVQNPAISGLMTSSTTPQTANSDSLFWQTPGPPNSYGNMYEVGYILTSNSAAGKYQLQRFYVAPAAQVISSTAAKTHNNSTYYIYDPSTAYTNSPAYTVPPWPLYSDAPWLTQLSPTNFQSSLSIISDGVIAFWVRCLDKNGDPIPWLYQSSLYGTSSSAPNPVTNLKFNSAAAFAPATMGTPTSFQYSYPPAATTTGVTGVPTGTAAANRLPSAVELTIITLDSRTLAQTNLVIPAMPAATSATDVPNEVQAYLTSLAANHIKTATVFTTTVRLANGTD